MQTIGSLTIELDAPWDYVRAANLFLAFVLIGMIAEILWAYRHSHSVRAGHVRSAGVSTACFALAAAYVVVEVIGTPATGATIVYQGLTFVAEVAGIVGLYLLLRDRKRRR